MRILPSIVSKLCYSADAWIVGSAASPDLKTDDPRDWDVAVPFSEWHVASSLIPRDANPNSFGGWKFTSEGNEVDVWPCDLALFMTYAIVTCLWHPKSGKRFVIYDGY